jgi:hypothetical protein
LVSDSGPGVSASLAKRLFEPFTQGDTSDAHRHGGAGRGLSIARRLAVAMNGGITVQSVVGTGTDFFVDVELRLPAAGWGFSDAPQSPICDASTNVLFASESAAVAEFCTDVLRDTDVVVSCSSNQTILLRSLREARGHDHDKPEVVIVDGPEVRSNKSSRRMHLVSEPRKPTTAKTRSKILLTPI